MDLQSGQETTAKRRVIFAQGEAPAERLSGERTVEQGFLKDELHPSFSIFVARFGCRSAELRLAPLANGMPGHRWISSGVVKPHNRYDPRSGRFQQQN
jgi:hypothetical protein